MKKILEKFPEDEEVSVLYPDDNYGVDIGVIISEVAYISGTKNVRNGVYIKLG
jgi:hypothetical protein